MLLSTRKYILTVTKEYPTGEVGTYVGGYIAFPVLTELLLNTHITSVLFYSFKHHSQLALVLV